MATRGMTLVLAFALPLACGVAQAADPSVDDILSALKPKAGNLNGTTRGIRAVAPDAEAPAATPHTHRIAMVRATQDTAPSAESTEGPSLDLTITFRSGSADITPAAASTLSKLGKALSSPSLAAYRFRIEGHTDTVGTKEENQILSQARAEKVASYLEQEFGVAADRLQPVGVGEDGLLVQTPDQTAEARNRRVHVVNLGS